MPSHVFLAQVLGLARALSFGFVLVLAFLAVRRMK